MSMPPKDIKPSDLWSQITALPKPHRIVDFPRKGPDGTPIAQLAMVVLTQEEEQLANLDTSKFLRKLLKDNHGQIPAPHEQDFAFKNLHELQAAIEILYRACRDAEDITKKFFPTKQAIGQHLTTDEVAILLRHYARTQAEIGPITSQMSQEEMDAWIDVLATGGTEYPLDYLSSAPATGFLMYMASQLYNLRKDRSSPTAPPEDIIEVE